MAFGASQRIISTDYNLIIGNSNTPGDALGPYSNEAAATNVGGLYGIGFGTVGYGRTTPPLLNVSQGSRILASQWNNLATVNNTIAAKTGSAITDYTPQTTLGNRILFLTNLQSNISTLVNNRFNTPSRILSAVKLTVTRVANWGSGGSTQINATVNAVFPSGNTARYFFNTGSEILLRLRHNSVSTPQDSSWNTFLSTQIGDIYFGPLGTRQVASSPGGTIGSGTGYWTTPPAFTPIFSRTAGTGPYSGLSTVGMEVSRVGAANIDGSGDNGNTLQFRITLTDAYAGFGDFISGGQTVLQIFDHTNNAAFTPIGTTSVTLVDGF